MRVEGWVSLGPISSEWGFDSLGRAAAQTGGQATTGCVGMPGYFVPEPPDDNLAEACFKLAAVDDQRLCGLRFWVCRGYFEQAACGQYLRSAGGVRFEGGWFRFRTCPCCKAFAVTKNLRCEEVCRILVVLRSGESLVVPLHSAHGSHGRSK